jgi:hypothetical protein
MPITRRKRANPPDDENNNRNTNDSNNGAGLTGSSEETSPAPIEQAAPMPTPAPVPPPEEVHETPAPVVNFADTAPFPPVAPTVPGTNGGGERQDYPPTIEGGRRTPRGELFHRPPQVPTATPTPVPAAPQAQAQPPAREISLPLGNLLHLAYNPAYTGADEARSVLLRKLANESKSGGRARCWNCGSIAIGYDCWNTRSKTFGEVGVAFCEVCGAWSVL